MIKSISIICNGDDFSLEKLKKYCSESDYIIAVDGGLKILDSVAIKPDLIIGDMDSIDESVLKKYTDVKIKKYPLEKDYTDSELALKKAIGLNPENIYIISGTGSYFDHSYANIVNLLRNKNKGINIKIITGNAEIFTVKKKLKLVNLINRRFSFFPICKVTGIDMEGCKYFFKKKKNLKFTDYSISNVITENKFKLKMKKGKIIFILFDEGYK